MSFLEFILSFCLLSLVGSAAIYGWWIVTRGSWEITPDGKWKKTGMIFKYWSLFWEQYRKTKDVYFAGEELIKKYNLLKKVRPDLAQKLSLLHGSSDKWLNIMVNEPLSDKDMESISDVLLCKIDINSSRRVLGWYVEQPVYDWPEWIQKPLSSCPACMSSVYGTPIWALFLKLQKDAFLWTNYPITAKICFWLIFLLTLATANSYVHQKLKF